MPKTLSLLAVLKKIDTKGLKSLSDPQWNTFLASNTEPNEIDEKIKKLEGYEEKGATYDATGELIVEDNQAMIDRFKARTGRASGRESLKAKRSKIDVASFKKDFLNNKEEPVKADTTGTSSLVPSKPPAPNTLPEGEETEGLKGIRDVLDDILKVLRLDFKGDRKEARDSQKDAAREKRGKREDKLEGVGKSAGAIGKAIQAIAKPFLSIWDIVMNFIKTVILGVLLNKILKWFGNPANQGKIKSLGKFFRDWWPALTTAALLFLTPLGGLVKGVVGLLTAIIPKLVMAIAANPWAAAAVLGGVAIYSVAKMAGGKKKEKPVDNEGDDMTTETTSQSFTTRGGPQAEQLKNQMAESRGEETQGFNQGGLVNVVDAQTSAQNFIHKFNGGGVVEHFNEGGMVGKELVYSIRKFTTEKVVKGDEIERTTGAIQLEDLYENQDQILSQLPEGTTIESIVNGTSDIDAEVLYPILQNSDAQAVSNAKERAVNMKFLQDNNLINSDNSVKGYSSFNQNFKGGGLVDTYNNLTKIKNYKQGGFVSGPGGVDKVPARLTVGEFVMSKGAVQKFGVNTLASMNAAGGGTNVPTITQEYNEGGLVQYFESGGIVRDMAKEPVGTPIVNSTNKTITLPTIPKQQRGTSSKSQSDIPDFRIPIISSQRSMVIASLGIEDLIGG